MFLIRKNTLKNTHNVLTGGRKKDSDAVMHHVLDRHQMLYAHYMARMEIRGVDCRLAMTLMVTTIAAESLAGTDVPPLSMTAVARAMEEYEGLGAAWVPNMTEHYATVQPNVVPFLESRLFPPRRIKMGGMRSNLVLEDVFLMLRPFEK